MMTREICKCCGDINRVGFTVPDDIWAEVTPEKWKDNVLCLGCFTRFGDEALIDWSQDIEFYPVPFVVFVFPIGNEVEESINKALEEYGQGKSQPIQDVIADIQSRHFPRV